MMTLRLDAFLPYRLSVASNAVSTRISASYRRRFGLKVPEWRLLAILAEGSEMTPQALGNAARIDKISVSRAAAALIERGLIVARANPGDGRSHLLALTTDGRGLYAEIAPIALAMEAELLGNFSQEERDQFNALLRRIEAAAGTDSA
ncbi:MAG: MarR family winged helix-turn-helix transcriptional regulator [Pseudomonadota bacterium]